MPDPRDQLTTTLRIAGEVAYSGNHTVQHFWEPLADAAIASGWRPPARMITDPVELDTLPAKAAVITPQGWVFQAAAWRPSTSGTKRWAQAFDVTSVTADYVIGCADSVTVLWTPQPKEEAPEDPSYWIAARDAHNDIRLRRGQGLLVAKATDTRADIQGWLDRCDHSGFRPQYLAALTLLDAEEANHA